MRLLLQQLAQRTSRNLMKMSFVTFVLTVQASTQIESFSVMVVTPLCIRTVMALMKSLKAIICATVAKEFTRCLRISHFCLRMQI